MPWLHDVLCARRGRQTPVWMVWAGYVVLFSGWLLGPVAGGFVLANLASEFYNLNDIGLRFVLYLLPLSHIAGLGWSAVMAVLEFRERSFAVMDARQMAPFALCMAGCLIALFCYLPIREPVSVRKAHYVHSQAMQQEMTVGGWRREWIAQARGQPSIRPPGAGRTTPRAGWRNPERRIWAAERRSSPRVKLAG